MRAVLVSEFGGPDQLRLGQAADPVAGPGQARIVVHAAGVNPVDAGNRADGHWAGLRVPCVLGYDVAGVIDSVGEGVDGLAPGDRVMAMTHFPDGAGGYAELAVVDADLAAPISAAVSFADAAATPLAAGTALMVLSRLGLPAASRLLVLGASGGVGLFLLQQAAAAGVVAIGVGRQAMHAQMTALGAAGCIDYTRDDVAARAQVLAGGPVDAIADLVGGTLAAAASGSTWLTTGRSACRSSSAASARVRSPSSPMSTPWKVMLASSNGSRSSSGVAIAAICPPGRSAGRAAAASVPPTKSAMASTGPPASTWARAATSSRV